MRMACFGKPQQISLLFSRLGLLGHSTVQSTFSGTTSMCLRPLTQIDVLTRCNFSSSIVRRDLMEFFDDPKNWGARDVRTGRSWTKDELRTKSNTDLHKLWYVLYKEKNMLLTMSEESDRINELFPNPERVYKVEESMGNLTAVVAERNKAAKLLELGITGERPKMTCYGGLGLKYVHKYKEHIMPYWHNPKHFPRRYVNDQQTRSQRDFLLKYWEKNSVKRNKQRRFVIAKLHAAQSMFPESPVWRDKDPAELTLEEVYHQKMSD